MQASYLVLMSILGLQDLPSLTWRSWNPKAVFPKLRVATSFQSGSANGSLWQKEKQEYFFAFFASSCIICKAAILQFPVGDPGFALLPPFALTVP